MRKTLFFMILIFFARAASADDLNGHGFIYGYLAGTYIVVGKTIDGDRTYSGRVVFEVRQDHLAVTRKIQGETITGIGKIEYALGSDNARVLRVRFIQKEDIFEITYLWHNDLDNYPRLTGYLYPKGKPVKHPGLEALFIDHAAR